MIKIIILVVVLCDWNVRASPSVGYVKSITTTPAPSSGDILMTSIEKVIREALEKTIKDYVEPLQHSVENLTQSLDQISINMEQLTAAALQSDERVASVERRVLNLILSLEQMSTNLEHLNETAHLYNNSQIESLWQQVRCGADSGYEYSNVTERCYRLYEDDTLWQVADERCRADGALLAVINSREEAAVLGNIRRTTRYSTFIGVYKNNTGHWTTVTGVDVIMAAGYHVWHTGDPLHEDYIRHGAMYKDDTIGTLNEVNVQPFICEKAALPHPTHKH